MCVAVVQQNKQGQSRQQVTRLGPGPVGMDKRAWEDSVRGRCNNSKQPFLSPRPQVPDRASPPEGQHNAPPPSAASSAAVRSSSPARSAARSQQSMHAPLKIFLLDFEQAIASPQQPFSTLARKTFLRFSSCINFALFSSLHVLWVHIRKCALL